jgi:hypothetical protein
LRKEELGKTEEDLVGGLGGVFERVRFG